LFSKYAIFNRFLEGFHQAARGARDSEGAAQHWAQRCAPLPLL